MNSTRCILALLLTGSLSAASAAELDGSVPLRCTAQRGHDCLATGIRCEQLQPQTKIAPVFGIDFAKKRVHSPYRTSLLHISQLTKNAESLILQGTDLLFVWNALINRKTGAMTVSITDRSGAYVVFGQCEIAEQQGDSLKDPQSSRPREPYADSPAELVVRSVRAAD